MRYIHFSKIKEQNISKHFLLFLFSLLTSIHHFSRRTDAAHISLIHIADITAADDDNVDRWKK